MWVRWLLKRASIEPTANRHEVRPHFVYLQSVPRRPKSEPLAGKESPQIHTGDAFQLVDTLAGSSVDLVITSPPYWGLRSYGRDFSETVLARWRAEGCDASRVPPYRWYRDAGGILGMEPYPHWYTAHLVEFFNRTARVLKESGSLWVNIGDTYFARWSSIRENGRQGLSPDRKRRRTPSGGYLQDKQLLLIPARFAIAMQEAGWILRNDLIWAKPLVLPRPEPDRLRLSHEHWFHFVSRRSRGRASYYYHLAAAEVGARDVVTCSVVAGTNGHSAAFPVGILRPRIETSSPPEGVVLDPFCGTGRAVIEAVRLGRTAIGFELSRKFATSARKDLRRAQQEARPKAASE
jgi:site-specific DNA-methyltransferase (cytosine-N4-specific)